MTSKNVYIVRVGSILENECPIFSIHEDFESACEAAHKLMNEIETSWKQITEGLWSGADVQVEVQTWPVEMNLAGFK